MKSELFVAALLATATLAAPLRAMEEPSDPNSVDIVDAIECRLAAPVYNGFALALNGEEKIADKRHWVRVDTKNPMMNEYDLPAPITVAGHYSTRRIAFTASGVLAILDLPDPSILAKEQKIENARLEEERRVAEKHQKAQEKLAREQASRNGELEKLITQYKRLTGEKP